MNKAIGLAGAVLFLSIATALAAARILSPIPLVRDTPRDLPWQLPDYTLATTQWSIGPTGKIHAQVEHFFLVGISPKMVAWFYQQLPISTVEYKGETLPLYHIFHPSEHGTVRVIEDAPDGTPGMASGALISRDEWFGAYDSRGTARILELSEDGMLAVPEIAGMAIGEVKHSFAAKRGGTTYRVDTVIGSDIPVIGRLLNLYLRTYVFHPEMIAQWQRHQLEEVASLQFFLPEIYKQMTNSNHYVVSSTMGAAGEQALPAEINLSK